MKNKLLFYILAAAGVLLISVTDGFSTNGRGRDVNTACASAEPFTGDCILCHTDSEVSDSKNYTDAMYAYNAGGTTLTDFFCPGLPPACNDYDADGYGDPGDSSCSTGSTKDCDDNDPSTFPGALEVCDDEFDNDCDDKIDCEDSDCNEDSNCLAASCGLYKNRRPCKTDPRCDWRGKGKTCYTVSEEKAACALGGGRWSKKNTECIYR